MAAFVCISDATQLAQDGFCPEWQEVTSVSLVGDPVSIGLIAGVSAADAADALASGAFWVLVTIPVAYLVRHVLRLVGASMDE